jgi:hypothetical protein
MVSALTMSRSPLIPKILDEILRAILITLFLSGIEFGETDNSCHVLKNWSNVSDRPISPGSANICSTGKD